MIKPRNDIFWSMDDCAYEKGIADLERLGFIRFDRSRELKNEDEDGDRHTTSYFVHFMNAMTSLPPRQSRKT
jgi:hypothetical protein